MLRGIFGMEDALLHEARDLGIMFPAAEEWGGVYEGDEEEEGWS